MKEISTEQKSQSPKDAAFSSPDYTYLQVWNKTPSAVIIDTILILWGITLRLRMFEATPDLICLLGNRTDQGLSKALWSRLVRDIATAWWIDAQQGFVLYHFVTITQLADSFELVWMKGEAPCVKLSVWASDGVYCWKQRFSWCFSGGFRPRFYGDLCDRYTAEKLCMPPPHFPYLPLQ